MKPKKHIIKLLAFDNYLSLITNSIGSKMFQNRFALMNGKKIDLVNGGEDSCTFFACTILLVSKIISDIHLTVTGALQDLKRSGWKEIKKPRLGCIIVWEEAIQADGKLHKHIGFYMGNDQAISNSFRRLMPVLHHVTWHGKRKISQLLWNPKLKN